MYKKILVPVDGSDLAECVLPQIKSLAEKNNGTEVILFHVWEPPVHSNVYPVGLRSKWEKQEKKPVMPPDDNTSDFYSKWKENAPVDFTKEERKFSQAQANSYLESIQKKLVDSGIKAKTEIGMGTPAVQIVDYAVKNQVDLILMATHGRSGVARWALGSVADKVLRTSPVPVMSIRPQECKLELS